jgi:mannose/fructose/N-acetylgalactosamine-specific phosphotransferase system component IID
MKWTKKLREAFRDFFICGWNLEHCSDCGWFVSYRTPLKRYYVHDKNGAVAFKTKKEAMKIIECKRRLFL